MLLISPVINFVFKPPEHHGLIHLLAGVNAFNDQMSKGIRNIDQTPPWMSPLKSSPKVEGMLRFFEDIEKNKNGSIGQKKSRDKSGGKDSSQCGKDGGIRSGGQKQNHSSRAAENLREDEKNKMDLKPRNKDEKKSKDERIKR
jgi:hypothetical protein